MVLSGLWSSLALTFVSQASILLVSVLISVSAVSFVSAELIAVESGADVGVVAVAALVVLAAADVEKISLLIQMMTPSNGQSLLENQASDFQLEERTKSWTVI